MPSLCRSLLIILQRSQKPVQIRAAYIEANLVTFASVCNICIRIKTAYEIFYLLFRLLVQQRLI